MSFTSIVVPVDLEQRVERILRYVGRLAGPVGLPVELLTVSSPLMPETCDRWELGRMAARLEEQGVTCRTFVVHSDDPASAIVAFLAGRPRPLLAMATHARGLLAETLLGSVSEAILARHPGPMLLFGPRTVLEDHPDPPKLVAALGEGSPSEAVLDAVVAWYNTFGGPAPWLVEGSAQWDVLHGRQPADALLEYAESTPDAVMALASERWTDPDHRHIASVARAVTRSCRHPVMIVPAHRAQDGAHP
jgi:nucleotide-binding universal stress UspA family protein